MAKKKKPRQVRKPTGKVKVEKRVSRRSLEETKYEARVSAGEECLKIFEDQYTLRLGEYMDRGLSKHEARQKPDLMLMHVGILKAQMIVEGDDREYKRLMRIRRRIGSGCAQ